MDRRGRRGEGGGEDRRDEGEGRKEGGEGIAYNHVLCGSVPSGVPSGVRMSSCVLEM